VARQQEEDQRVRYDLDEFMYKRQFQRRMNPVYLPLTKEGAGLIAFAYVVFLSWGGGIEWLLAFGLLTSWVYKNKFRYRYYEVEQLWGIQKLSTLLTKRRKHLLEHEPFVFKPEKKGKANNGVTP
jgi:hypothetical protein